MKVRSIKEMLEEWISQEKYNIKRYYDKEQKERGEHRIDTYTNVLLENEKFIESHQLKEEYETKI